MKQKRSWVAGALLITGFFVTIYAASYIKSDVDNLDKKEFAYSCNEISSKITNRLYTGEQVLRSGAAFINGSDTVTRKEWKAFVEESKLNLNLNRIQDFGFSIIVTADKLQQHIQKIRNEGFPEYTVKPEGRRETYTSIVFLEPFSSSNLSAFGYDMFSEPVRREAMERARDRNVVALSGKVMLVKPGTDVQTGNLIYVPVYRKGAETNTIEQRRNAIIGWVYSPYRMNDFMSGILEGWELKENKKLYLHIFDGMECTPQSMLFESHIPDEQNASEKIRFSIQIPVDFNGHRWTLVFTQRAGNMFIDYISAWTVFFGGFLISILLFFIAKILINIESKARLKAEILTSELIESEKRFQTIFEASPVPLVLTRLSDGIIILANKQLGKLFSISTTEAIGKKSSDFYVNPDDRYEIIEALAKNGSLNEREMHFKKEDGRLFWAHASFQILIFGSEPLIISGFYDITKRRQAEEEIQKVNRIYAVLSNINQAIVRVQDKQDKQTLFEEVCRIAVEDGKFRMVWIGMFDPQTNIVNPVASAGYTEDYLKTININLDDEILGNGPTGRSIKSGIHYLANDIANNPEMIPWSANALKLGYKSTGAFPLIVFGRTIGTLNLYANEPFFFDDAEVKLLDELAIDISFGIEFIENNNKRKLAEEEIRLLNEDLEQKVEKRTKELAEINLILQKGIEERDQAEERIRLVYEASPYSILLVDSKGTIRLANHTTEEYFGYDISQLIGSNISMLMPKVEGMDHPANMGNFFANPKRRKMGAGREMFALKKDGSVFPVEIGLTPIEIDGEMMVLTNIIDITERRQTENIIKQAKLEAEQANLAKSEFLSRMSHELRTPMNSILGFAQLMDMGELKPAHKKGVDHILKSGKHLLDLINEVLDISKIEAGHISLFLEPIAMCPLVKEMLDIVSPLAAKKQITLEVAPHDELFVKADYQRLKQVLLNLVNNAIKYNQQNGFVKIDCEITDAAEKQNSTIRISISDSGAGITTEDIKKLFTPFERIGAEKTETEGTGLGLAVAKKLIEAMHGTIGVESKVGLGSTFWIELPQTESQIDRHKRLSDQVIPEQEKALVSGTILYIEDNISNMQLVEQILEAHRPSIRLITEMYGKNAVKLATDFAPDLILLDLDLPDIHGSEVLKLLQAGPKTAAIPVVVISADAMAKQINKLMEAGAKDYLTKPLDVVEFLKVVDKMIKAPFPFPHKGESLGS
ncbi:MAG: hypothetical protein C0397_05995 [Odoribacter sp.]|nr:hypothetical protein [Odoribacter sp.]